MKIKLLMIRMVELRGPNDQILGQRDMHTRFQTGVGRIFESDWPEICHCFD